MPSINETNLGSYIKTAIEKNHWSLRNAALKIGVSPAYLSKLINKKADSNPKPETLDKLAQGLHVPAKEIYEAANMSKELTAPSWATEQDFSDLERYLNDNTKKNFEGAVLDDEAVDATLSFLRTYFWQRKNSERNSRRDDTDE